MKRIRDWARFSRVPTFPRSPQFNISLIFGRMNVDSGCLNRLYTLVTARINYNLYKPANDFKVVSVKMIEVYQSNKFIDKYIRKAKSKEFHDDMKSTRTKINKILAMENLAIDDEANLVLYSDDFKTETRICNFAVFPTHLLLYDDGNQIHEAGLAVEVYTKFHNGNYKFICANLTDDVIDKGTWLNTTYVDRDCFVYKSELYRYLKIAIKLSYRIIKRKSDIKIFHDQEWLEHDDALKHLSIFDDKQNMLEYRQLNNSSNQTDSLIRADAIQFLKALQIHISEIEIHPIINGLSKTSEQGLEDDTHYYLIYTQTWSWVRSYFNRNQISLNTKEEKKLDHYLIDAGVFESNEIRAKTSLKRADRRHPPLKPRVFMINKNRLVDFLQNNNQ